MCFCLFIWLCVCPVSVSPVCLTGLLGSIVYVSCRFVWGLFTIRLRGKQLSANEARTRSAHCFRHPSTSERRYHRDHTTTTSLLIMFFSASCFICWLLLSGPTASLCYMRIWLATAAVAAVIPFRSGYGSYRCGQDREGDFEQRHWRRQNNLIL